jgi:hypothetical protein
MADAPLWDDREQHAADLDFSAFKQAVQKQVGAMLNMHAAMEQSAANMRTLSAALWRADLDDAFGEHPPRIFHDGP